MKKQRSAHRQYRGDLFYDMPAPLMKYRRHDKKRMEMFDVAADKTLREEERKWWKRYWQRRGGMQP